VLDWGVTLNLKKGNDSRDDLNIKIFVELMKTITPDITNILETRYSILRIINYLQPIGRRNLSNKLGLSERNIRTEASVLKKQGLIEITSEGMNITPLGKNTIEKFKIVFHNLRGINELEKRVENIIKIKKVIVVPGSVESDELVFKEIGRAAANYLKNQIKEDSIIGLTGGTTMAHVVEEYGKNEREGFKNTIIVPARGGLGKKVEYQANTLVQKLANKMNSRYKLLYTPDYLSKDAINSLMNEPIIREIMDYITKLDILVFGIGRADVMAKRRGLDKSKIEDLLQREAVSEAFGYYFNDSGEILHEISTIGIKLEQYKNMENIIAVAGGSDKAESIMAISKLNKSLVLITDESAAKKIILKYKEE